MLPICERNVQVNFVLTIVDQALRNIMKLIGILIQCYEFTFANRPQPLLYGRNIFFSPQSLWHFYFFICFAYATTVLPKEIGKLQEKTKIIIEFTFF